MVVRPQRLGSLFTILTLLLAVSAYAAPGDAPVACPQPFLDADDARPSTIQPLLAEERLLYSIENLPAWGALEVRYRVDGRLHLTETVDLGGLELPLTREPQAP